MSGWRNTFVPKNKTMPKVMFRSDAGEFNKHLPYKDILKGGQKPEFYTSKPDGIGHQVGDIFLRRECARTHDWEAGETSWPRSS